MKKIDVIVLGAGVAGLGAAIPLQRAGKKVLVIRKKVAGESSPAAGGIIDPFLEMKPRSPLFKLCCEAFRRYSPMVRHLAGKTRMEMGFAKIGMMYVAMNPEEEKELRRRFSWQKKSGIPVIWLSREQILKKEPEISRQVRSGIFYPSIPRIHPERFQKALERYAQKLGVRFLNVRNYPEICIQKKSVSGVCVDKKWILSNTLIYAAGAWAGIKEQAFKLPVEPVRGQILIVQGRFKAHSILHSLKGAYIVPWKSNQYLIGSTVEHAGFNPKVTSDGIKSIRRRNAELAPRSAGLKTIRSWAGLRPFSKDRLPFIGKTNVKGLYAAAGYYRSGILISSYAGEKLSRAILTGKVPDILKPFSPQRLK